MWLIYAIIAGITQGLGGLFAKKAAFQLEDSWMRSFYFSLFGTIIVLPFFLWEFSLPSTHLQAALILLAGIIIVAGNYFSFKAFNTLSPSTISVISKLKLVWIVLIGFFIFSQALSLTNMLGIIIIFSASIIIADFRHWKSNKAGVQAVVFSTLGTAAYASLLTILTQTIEPFSLLFYVCIIPMLLNGLLIPRIKTKIKKTYMLTKMIFFNALIAMVTNMCYILGVKEEFTKFFFAMEASIIVIIVGEYFWLKDRMNIPLKIIGILLAITGAILVR